MQFCTCVGSADSEEKTSGTSCQILSKMKQRSVVDPAANYIMVLLNTSTDSNDDTCTW